MISKMINKYKTAPTPLKASIWFVICAFLQKGISVITTPIFTRLLTTSEYGDYSAFNSWLGIITVFVTLHMFSGVFQQGLVKFDEEKKIFASSVQGLSFVLFLIFTFIYVIFSDFFNKLLDLTTNQFLAMLVMIWCSNVFNLWATNQRVDYKYKMLVVISLIVSVMKPVVEIILVVNSQDKVTAMILGIMIVELIGYSWLFIYELHKGKKFYSKNYWIYTLKLSIPLIPHYLSQIVLNNTDRIMIKNIVGSSEAGIYSVAYSVSMIMTLFNNSILQTLTPWIYKKIKLKKTADISKITFPALIFVGVLNVCLIAFAPEIISIFAPKSYIDAIYVIPPVAISVYFLFEFSLFSSFEFYYEKSKLTMVASLVGAILNIVLNLIFIRMFGYLAAGYTTLICYITYAFAHYLIMKNICHKNLIDNPYNGKKLALYSALFISIAGLFLSSYNLVYLRYSIIACSLLVSLLFCKKIYRNIINVLKEFKKEAPETTN